MCCSLRHSLGSIAALVIWCVALALAGRLSAGNAYWNDNTSFNFSTEQIGAFDSNLFSLGCPDGKLLTYGTYSVVNGVSVGARITRLNIDGSLDQTFLSPSGATPLAVLTDGRCYVRDYPNSPSSTNRLRRLNVDGSVDTTFAAVTLDYDIYGVLVLSNGQLAVHGLFSTVNGITQRSLVRLNSDGTLDASFTSPFATTSYYVTSVAEDPTGKLLVGGANFAFGSGREKLVRLNANGSVDTNWAVSGVTGSGSAIVYAATPSSAVLANFGSGLVRLDHTGAKDASFTPATTGSNVGGIKFTRDNFIYYGSTDGTNTYRIRRLQLDGSADNSFTPLAASSVIPTGNGLFYPATDTPHLQARQPLLRAAADGTPDTAFTPPRFSRPGTISCFSAQPDGKILVVGSWSYANGAATAASPALVRLNVDGSTDNTFAASLPAGASVSGLAIQPDGSVLVGGSFTIGGITRTLIRFSASGAPDASFPVINDYFGKALTDASGRIYLNRFDASNLVRLAADGARDASFNTSALPQVTDFVVRPDGGAWVVANNQLQLLDSTGTASASFSSRGLPNYNALVGLPDGTLVVITSNSTNSTVRQFAATGATLLTYQTPFSTISPGWDESVRLTVFGLLFDLLRSTQNSTPQQWLISAAENNHVSCSPAGRLIVANPSAPFAVYDRSSNSTPSYDPTPGAIILPSLKKNYSLMPINSRASWSFAVYGLHPITIAWSKDGTSVGDNSATYVHEITGAASAGTIRASISNAYGTSVSPDFAVTVSTSQIVAKIHQGLSNRSVLAGTPVTLSVEFEAAPAPTIRWYRNGNLIPDAAGASLDLGAVQPTQAGEYEVTVWNTVYASEGTYNGRASSSATLTVFATPFDQWTATRFTSTELQNSTVSGPAADPDADGFSNLTEYALGLDPRVASPGAGLSVTNNGTDWIVTYSRPTDRTAITYRLERSHNLVDWTDTDIPPTRISQTDGVDTWRATYPTSSAPICFFRLVVTL